MASSAPSESSRAVDRLLEAVRSARWPAVRRFVAAFALHLAVAGTQKLVRWIRDMRGAKDAAARKALTARLLESLPRLFLRQRAWHAGLWAAAFGFLYRCALAATRSPAVAGGVAGLSVVLLEPLRHTYLDATAIGLHASVRAVEQLLRHGADRGVLPHVEHADLFFFVVACAEIMYSWFYHPSALPKTYVRWITKVAAMDTTLLVALRDFKEGRLRYGMHTDLLRDFCHRHHCLPQHGNTLQGFISCSVIHPHDGTSCRHNALRRAARGFYAALFLYGPVHLLSFLLTRGPALLWRPTAPAPAPPRGLPPRDASAVPQFELVDSETNRPSPTPSSPSSSSSSSSASSSSSPTALLPFPWRERLRELVVGLLRVGAHATQSSAFLGTFVGLVWSGVCFMRNLLHDETTLGPLLGSCLCGFSILLERKSRRSELACYVVPRALQSLWSRLLARGWARPVPAPALWFACFASAVLLHFFEMDRSADAWERAHERVHERAHERPRSGTSMWARAPDGEAQSSDDDAKEPREEPGPEEAVEGVGSPVSPRFRPERHWAALPQPVVDLAPSKLRVRPIVHAILSWLVQ